MSNCFLDTCLYPQIDILSHVEEASGCSVLLLTEKLLTGQNAEDQWLQGLSSKRDPYRPLQDPGKIQEAEGKNVRVTVLPHIILYTYCCTYEFTAEAAICTRLGPLNIPSWLEKGS